MNIIMTTLYETIVRTRYNGRLENRLSINKPSKRGKEKRSSDRLCQCEKEMDDHLLACPQLLEKEPHSDTAY
jgi:hypothetical protein